MLHGPAVAAQIAEGDVEDPRDPGPCRDVLLALGTRRIDVRVDQVQALDRAQQRADDHSPYCDRAGKSLQTLKKAGATY